MRLLISITIFFITFTHSVFAKELNGNLDYSVKQNGDIATLTLLNKRNDTAASLSSVSILLASEHGKESLKFEVPLSQSNQISPNTTVSLGAISTLAQKIAPNIDTSQFNRVSVSENPDCSNCMSVPFGLKMNVDYQGGAKQENLTGAYLLYFFK